MYKIGLTGGIGSGKTYIAEIFSRLGIPVFNSDIEGKKCIQKNDSVRKQIINLFGKGIYNNDKLTDEYMAMVRSVTGDNAKREQAENIIIKQVA